MRYKIFLCDFDGTLVRADGTVSERNLKAITEYRKKGGVFAVVTGRGISAILPRMNELGLKEGLLVAFQGAAVVDIKTGKLLKNGGFPLEDALSAIRACEEEDVHLQIYSVEEFFCNRDDKELKMYESTVHVKATVVEDEPLSALTERRKLRIVKLLTMVDPSESEALAERLRVKLGENFFITRSMPYFVELMPKNETKANAVEFLSEYYHVPIERIAAIGDQLNDLPMIERAGGKFTVQNADEALKKIAMVMPSNEEDGVAYALQYAGEEE